MRRNSVVSVFLRVLEYYSGILFLTTNKVGHFDEAFKSRIHVSLYYPALNKRSTLKIWKMNLERLSKSKKVFEVETEDIYDYARRHYRDLYKKGKTTWNGRQIKNAFQTAIALAEFEANKKEAGKPVLKLEHFEIVARASEDFDDYLCRVHGGTEADLAMRYQLRDDEPVDARRESLSYTTGAMKDKRRHEISTSSSSSEDPEAREKRKRKKERRQKKKAGKTKPVPQASEDATSSSSSGTK